MFARIRSVVRMLLNRDAFEHSMDEEMRFHMQAYADDLVRAGATPDDARRKALVAFGSQGAAQEECREARGIRAFDELRQDTRYALRQVRRSPGFAAAAIISVALGIGANVAIFGLMDAILFRTMPVRDPGSLYFLAHSSGGRKASTSSNYPLLARYQSSGIFESVTSTSQRPFNVSFPDGPERAEGEYVSGNYHATLGVRMALGRGFSSEPDRPDGRGAVAVISDSYWTRRFARDPRIIGKTLSIDGRPVTIIGVTAAGFHGIVPGIRMDISMPLFVRAMESPVFLDQRDRWISIRMVGRLKPGRTETQARAAVEGLFARYWKEPENGQQDSERIGTLVPAGRGATDVRERYGAPLWLLFGMVAIVLLIACTNVANLVLARGANRSREVAVRLSLGAGRARLVRQMLTESSALAVVGAAIGLVLAVVSMRSIASVFMNGDRPLFIDAKLSAQVLVFTAVAAIGCSLIIGLIPALRSSRIDLTPAMKNASRRPRRGRWTLGRSLVTAQLALSCLVVTMAALLARSVFNMRSVDAGFSREHTLLFNIDAGPAAMSAESRSAFFAALEQRLLALPGVSSVAYTQRSPLDQSTQTRPIEIPGITVPKAIRGVSANIVTSAYFSIFGIRLLRGRSLTTDDRTGSEPVAVVDEGMVRSYFGDADPLGRRIFLGADREPFTIVGVVASARTENLREEAPRSIYTALPQSRISSNSNVGEFSRITVAVQMTVSPTSLTSAVRNEVTLLSPQVIVSYLRSMEEQVATSMERERLMAGLSGAYGALALLLSLVGLYGVTAYGVAQRAHDIGVRMALGATQRRVVSSILRETSLTTAIGIMVGATAAAFAAQLVAPFLFNVAPHDPVTFSGVALSLVATALLAAWLPGRRAASIDPVRTLKG